MTFKFACPHCSQRISAETSDVHTVGVCPSCRKNFEVPNPKSEVPSFRLSLPSIVVGLLCLWSIDTLAAGLAASGKPMFAAFFQPLWLILLCSALDGILCGIAIAAVCPQRVLIHVGFTFLLYQAVGIFFGILFSAVARDLSVFLPLLLKLVGALGAGLVIERKLTRPYRHVVFEGIGEAWEPRQQRGLAIFFSMCLAMAILPDAAIMLGFARIWDAMFTSDKRIVPVLLMYIAGMGSATLGPFTSLLIKGIAFLGLVRRCYPRDASTLISDPGRNVVWLRPFDVDGMPQGLTTVAQLAFSTWQRLLGRTLEQRIYRCFRGFAELVAFGMPGEKLPQAGAARLYVDHAHWQSIASALMQRSAGVILHAVVSEGTLWEWSQALALLPRTRLLLCVPVRGPSWRRNRKYQELRTQIEQTTGLLLPENAEKNAAFAFFESDDSERAVWLTRRGRVPELHPLAPALMRIRRLKLALTTQSGLSLVILFTLLAAVLVYFCVMMRLYTR